MLVGLRINISYTYFALPDKIKEYLFGEIEWKSRREFLRLQLSLMS